MLTYSVYTLILNKTLSKPNGKWFYIEFWKPSGAQAYVDKLNAEYKP